MRMRNMRNMRIMRIAEYADADADRKSHPHIPHTEGKKLVFLKGNRSSSHVLSGA